MSLKSRAINHLPHEDYVALAAFRHALRRFQHFSEEAAERAGLSPQQHQALLAIKASDEEETMTVGLLAEHLLLRHHSTVGLVDRLVKKKLVKRSHKAGDRRKVYITLTPAGAAVINRLSADHKSELQRVGPELGRWLGLLGGKPKP